MDSAMPGLWKAYHAAQCIPRQTGEDAGLWKTIDNPKGMDVAHAACNNRAWTSFGT